jgi:hypothetical protein
VSQGFNLKHAVPVLCSTLFLTFPIAPKIGAQLRRMRNRTRKVKVFAPLYEVDPRGKTVASEISSPERELLVTFVVTFDSFFLTETKNSLRTNPVMPPGPSWTLAHEPINSKTLSDVPVSIFCTMAAAKLVDFLIGTARWD